MSEITVRDAPSEKRFEAYLDGELAGFLDYARSASHLMLVHTEAFPQFGGRGVGSALARGAMEAARAEGVRVLALCSFVVAWVGKHPEFADITDLRG
ncbi:hypothetical protein Afil01_18940 [Actinorhabdospora filicis]|uniref:N-acetyltransferase domain-containing protein n=1 Tax=Actinorhabdospora filicis TaxID=1785913 RepID=A0A9W6SJR8_9ACTN|nr:GNAT family N-acetyltransferase [Actinorhabdospora filicis]GLZ77087.1 hypothetical protein Afil01_18940 [Actinorhabdospora filicis]